MTHLFITADFIVNSAIANRRKNMWKNTVERASNVHLFTDPEKEKREEKEKQ